MIAVLAMLWSSVSASDSETRRERRRGENIEYDQKYSRVKLGQKVQRKLSGLPDEDRAEVLYAMLEDEIPKQEKALALYELARLHENIEDFREALRLSGEAHALDVENGTIHNYFRRMNRLVNPKPTAAKNFRLWNAGHGLSLSTNLELDYQTNVIQESIEPASPTNKEDTSFNFSATLIKAWNAKLDRFSQESTYYLSSNNYFDHMDLNLLVNNLEHRFAYATKNGEDDIDGSFKLALSQITSDNKALLWNWETGTSWIYNHVRSGILYDATLNYRYSYYHSSVNAGQQGDNISLVASGGRAFGSKKQRMLRFELSEILEDPRLNTSQYWETTAKLSCTFSYREMWLDSFTPHVGFTWRDYRGASAGSAAREDQLRRYGFKLNRKVNQHQSVDLKLESLENDSNLVSSHYRNHQILLGYNIKY